MQPTRYTHTVPQLLVLQHQQCPSAQNAHTRPTLPPGYARTYAQPKIRPRVERRGSSSAGIRDVARALDDDSALSTKKLEAGRRRQRRRTHVERRRSCSVEGVDGADRDVVVDGEEMFCAEAAANTGEARKCQQAYSALLG